jgi:hypothetical protein
VNGMPQIVQFLHDSVLVGFAAESYAPCAAVYSANAGLIPAGFLSWEGTSLVTKSTALPPLHWIFWSGFTTLCRPFPIRDTIVNDSSAPTPTAPGFPSLQPMSKVPPLQHRLDRKCHYTMWDVIILEIIRETD